LCRLFSVDVDVEADLYVSYTFKLETSHGVQLCVGLTFDRPTDVSQLYLVGNDYISQSDVGCLRPARQQSVVGMWTTRCVLSH